MISSCNHTSHRLCIDCQTENEIEALKAENEKLRAALNRVAAWGAPKDSKQDGWWHITIAREALAEVEKG